MGEIKHSFVSEKTNDHASFMCITPWWPPPVPLASCFDSLYIIKAIRLFGAHYEYKRYYTWTNLAGTATTTEEGYITALKTDLNYTSGIQNLLNWWCKLFQTLTCIIWPQPRTHFRCHSCADSQLHSSHAPSVNIHKNEEKPASHKI